MSKKFEKVIASYGYPEAVSMNRKTAQSYAEQKIGAIIDGLPLTSALFRVVGYRLEDHAPDGSKGVVIAQCEPLQGWSTEWRPGPEETK